MKTIIKKYIKKFGYKPTEIELNNLHKHGYLILTDKEENELIKKEYKRNFTCCNIEITEDIKNIGRCPKCLENIFQ